MSFLPTINAIPLIETFLIHFDIEDKLTVQLEIFTLDNREYPTWVSVKGYGNSIRHYEDRNITGVLQAIIMSKFEIQLNTTDLGDDYGPIVYISLGFKEPTTDTTFLFQGHINLNDKRDPFLSTGYGPFVFDTNSITAKTKSIVTSSLGYYYYGLIFLIISTVLKRMKNPAQKKSIKHLLFVID